MLMDGNSVTHHPDLHLRSIPCTGGLDAPETGAPDRRSPTLLTGCAEVPLHLASIPAVLARRRRDALLICRERPEAPLCRPFPELASCHCVSAARGGHHFGPGACLTNCLSFSPYSRAWWSSAGT